MDLYDFIRNDLAALSGENESAETTAGLQNEKESLTAGQEVLPAGAASLEKERDALYAKLQAAESDRERLLGRIASLEKNAETLQREQNDLEMQMQARSSEKDNALREANDLLKVKSSEIELLRKNISELQQKLSGTLDQIEHAETEKIGYLAELKMVREDLSVSVQKTKKAIWIACIAVLVAAAVFFSHYKTRTASEPKKAAHSVSVDKSKVEKTAERKQQNTTSSDSPSQTSAKDFANAGWPTIMPFALDLRNFRVSLVPLKSGTVKRLPEALRHEETDKHDFYLVKIRAVRGTLSPEFMKSPSIDFINKDNVSAQMSSSGSGLRVARVPTYRKRHANRSVRCLVSLRKDFHPIGIIIGPLNKETRRIVIF
ncbi:MAG: hypothetical protein HQL09_05100 [Nitrospirae bacterium]|nr:hypothetical protein [Nitrospirota bacterium]